LFPFSNSTTSGYANDPTEEMEFAICDRLWLASLIVRDTRSRGVEQDLLLDAMGVRP
jgi:hypothetical protein